MYNITREQASKMLNISTRSIDRYIRSWKLRHKKDWKIVYIHQDDIDNFLNPTSKQEIIIRNNDNNYENEDDLDKSLVANIYEDLKNEIKIKDEQINTLNVQLWRMEEALKNSISLIEFKKTQFLLEESKNSLNEDLENTKKEIEMKISELKNEKRNNIILLIISIIFFILLFIVWFYKI